MGMDQYIMHADRNSEETLEFRKFRGLHRWALWHTTTDTKDDDNLVPMTITKGQLEDLRLALKQSIELLTGKKLPEEGSANFNDECNSIYEDIVYDNIYITGRALAPLRSVKMLSPEGITGDGPIDSFFFSKVFRLVILLGKFIKLMDDRGETEAIYMADY